jgi:hypothetical protein
MLCGLSARFLWSWMVGFVAGFGCFLSTDLHGCVRILMGFVWKVFIDDYWFSCFYGRFGELGWREV